MVSLLKRLKSFPGLDIYSFEWKVRSFIQNLDGASSRCGFLVKHLIVYFETTPAADWEKSFDAISFLLNEVKYKYEQ